MVKKKYLYGGKQLTLKQLNQEFNIIDNNINKYYKDVRQNGGGFLSRFRGKKGNSHEKVNTIITSTDAKQLIDDFKDKKAKIVELTAKSTLSFEEKKTLDVYEKEINEFEELLENIKKANIHGYKHHDNWYEYKDNYNNLWRFAGVGIAMTFIFGGISLGTAPTAITALGLVISWMFSKYSTHDEMQKMLIIVLCNTLHMRRNISKIRRIYQKKTMENKDIDIDKFLEKDVSPLFKTITKQIDEFIEALFKLAGDGSAEHFILFLEYEKITSTNNINLENIDIDKMISKKKQSFYKVKQFLKYLNKVFTIDDKYRIMIREANQCLNIFTLLISDVLIYAINSNAVGKHIELENTAVEEAIEQFPDANNKTDDELSPKEIDLRINEDKNENENERKKAGTSSNKLSKSKSRSSRSKNNFLN